MGYMATGSTNDDGGGTAVGDGGVYRTREAGQTPML